MEENNNNNNDNKVVEKMKQEGKKVGKNIMIKILPKLLPVIGIFIVIILALGVINVIPYLIKNWFFSLLGFGDSADADASVLDTSKRIVCINEYGGYDISVENFSEQILQKLEEQKVDNKAAEFITKDSEDMIDKYVKAEVQTMYPKTNRPGDLDGLIKVQRASAETGEVKTLNYVPYEEFNTSTDILDKFSINPETFDLCIATRNITQYYQYSRSNDEGKEITSMRETEINRHEIEYQTSVQGYAMPFNFLLSLHMISQDEGFMKDLIDEILKKDDPIILTYVESASIETTTIDYSGTVDVIKVIEEKNLVNNDSEPEKSDTTTNTINVDNSNIDDYYTTLGYWRKKITTNTGYLCVTKADTFFQSVEKEIGEVNSQESPTSSSNPSIVLDDTIEETPIENILRWYYR